MDYAPAGKLKFEHWHWHLWLERDATGRERTEVETLARASRDEGLVYCVLPPRAHGRHGCTGSSAVVETCSFLAVFSHVVYLARRQEKMDMDIALITARLVAGAVQTPFYGHAKFPSKSFGVRLGHTHLGRKRKRMGNRRVDLTRDDGIAADFTAINLHPIT